jgi:hypothetical protein
MESKTVSDYTLDIYKNWAKIDYLRKTVGVDAIVISNKIKKTSDNGPYIDGDISDFIYLQTKQLKLSDEELIDHIKIAIWYIKKGNPERVFEILKAKQEKPPIGF